MSEEVKIDLRSEWMSVMSAHTPNYEGWLESLVISERQARLEAEAKLQNAVRSSILWQSEFNNAEARLKALEDAISDLGYKVAVWQMYPGKTLDILSQAIQESRTRRQNDDTTI